MPLRFCTACLALFLLPLAPAAEAAPLGPWSPAWTASGSVETSDASWASVADAKALARRVHAAVNSARRAEGLPALAFDPALAAVAAVHSADMAARGFFAHASPEGLRSRDRVEAAAYPFRRLGENLYRGSAYDRIVRTRTPRGESVRYEWRDVDVQAAHVVRQWLASPGHRRNLLSPHFETHGVGVAPGPDHTWYVTQNLVEAPAERPALAAR